MGAGHKRPEGHLFVPCLGSSSLALFAKHEDEIRQLCKQNQGPGLLPGVFKVLGTGQAMCMWPGSSGQAGGAQAQAQEATAR